MILNNIDFETYFKHYPDNDGYFGKFGGDKNLWRFDG